MHKLYVNGTAFVYEAAGPAPENQGTGDPPIVLLHGFPLDARVWAEVARPLTRRWRVIRPNLRGFGTFTSNEPFTIQTLAQDVLHLLEETGDLPCVMVGLSMGGYVALSFAQNWSDQLRGLALVDTRAEADDAEGRRKREAAIALLRRKGVGAIAEQMLPNMVSDATREGDPAAVEAVLRVMLDAPAPTVEAALRAMRDRADYTDLLATIGVPTSVIVGADDAITPVGLSRAMADAVPGAELEIIEGAGHMAPAEQPEAVYAAIARLMERIRGGAAN